MVRGRTPPTGCPQALAWRRDIKGLDKRPLFPGIPRVGRYPSGGRAWLGGATKADQSGPYGPRGATIENRLPLLPGKQEGDMDEDRLTALQNEIDGLRMEVDRLKAIMDLRHGTFPFYQRTLDQLAGQQNMQALSHSIYDSDLNNLQREYLGLAAKALSPEKDDV